MRLIQSAVALTGLLLLTACATTSDSVVVESDTSAAIEIVTKARAAPAPLPIEDQLQRWFNTAKERVEAETGVDLGAVYLKKMKPLEMQHANEEALAYLYKDNPTRLAIMRSVVKNASKPQYRSVVALFNPARNAILLSDTATAGFFRTARVNNVSDEEAFTVLMTHELVHAADRTRYSTGAYADPTRLMSLGVRAVIEGHAQYLTSVICEREGCMRGYRLLRDDVVSGIGTDAHLANPQAQFSAGVSEFMYFYGERFFSKLKNSPDRIEQALKEPPVDPVQIRFPLLFPDRERARRGEVLASVFEASIAPWKFEDAVIYRNNNYLPAANYPRDRVLAQENFDIYQSGSPENNTNIGLYWYTSGTGAGDLFQTLSAKPKNSPRTRSLYSSVILERKTSPFNRDSTEAHSTGKIAVTSQRIVPTKKGLSIGIKPITLTTTVGMQGPFIVQTTQRMLSGVAPDISAYVISLLESLALH